MDPGTRVWTAEERVLWHNIAAHRFDDPGTPLDFTHRLARTLGWTLDMARAAIEEYRRFCFLAAVSATPVTPSEDIDEVWHLHLTDSRDYWERWCPNALGRLLHHDATSGAAGALRRHRAQYAATLALYESYFGQADRRFWPGFEGLFRSPPRFRLIDRDRTMTVPRPSLRALRAAIAPVLAAALAVVSGTKASAMVDNPLDMTGEVFLTFYIPLIGGGLVLAWLLRLFVNQTGQPVDTQNLTAIEIARLSGGIARAVDTLVVTLAAQSHVHFTKSPTRIALDALPPEQRDFGPIGRGSYRRGKLIKMIKDSTGAQRLEARLFSRNLLLSAQRRRIATVGSVLLVLPILALGGAKIAVGISRGKPVGILMFLVIVGGAFLFVAIKRSSWLTSEGKSALKALRASHDRAIRAPLADELPLAFAFVGAPILAGTPHAAYAAMVGSGSSSDSSGGDGGGGGGCGGCGS